jgi:exo-beta-1,3-glucanase (GH17 family)
MTLFQKAASTPALKGVYARLRGLRARGTLFRDHVPAAFFVLAAAAILSVWAWLGAPIDMPPSPLGPAGKVDCISYAPFRGNQDPFGPDVPIDRRQIEEDLARLAPLTGCIRTYSVDHGLDQIPEVAARYGMKVMLGIWLSNLPDLTRHQIEVGVALARRFPDVVQSVVVGNEVLLRGEMSAPDLANTIRSVKAQVGVPVTYADVWEFWLRYREVAPAVDFITIHILPYWEDFPLPVEEAARHIDSIRSRVAEAFPGREILVGEFGWPSAGRMREGALPSPANQARAIAEALARAKSAGYRINLIEAFDQPWKRQLEGTVGGHWGLYDAYDRAPKFSFGDAVSNHPGWAWQAGFGVTLAAAEFALAWALRGRAQAAAPLTLWAAIAAIAGVSGTLIGWTVGNVPLESLTAGDWLRSLGWALLAVAAPLACVAALARGTRPPSFAQMLASRQGRPQEPLALLLGGCLIALAVLAVQAALGLDFDPRYRDFPFSPLTGAAFPFLVVSLMTAPGKGRLPAAEASAAALLVLSTAYIAVNETFANWQALWFCAGLLAVAITLVQVRAAPG